MNIQRIPLEYLHSKSKNRYALCVRNSLLLLFDTMNNDTIETGIKYNEEAIYAVSAKQGYIIECAICGSDNRLIIYDYINSAIVYNESGLFGIDTAYGAIVSVYDKNNNLIIISERLNGKEDYWISISCLNYQNQTVSLIKKIEQETLFNMSISESSVVYLETSKIYSNDHFLHKISLKTGYDDITDLNVLRKKGWVENSIHINESAQFLIGIPNVCAFSEYSLLVASLCPFEIINSIPLDTRLRLKAAEINAFWISEDVYCIEKKDSYILYQLHSSDSIFSVKKEKTISFPALITPLSNEKTLWLFGSTDEGSL